MIRQLSQDAQTELARKQWCRSVELAQIAERDKRRWGRIMMALVFVSVAAVSFAAVAIYALAVLP